MEWWLQSLRGCRSSGTPASPPSAPLQACSQSCPVTLLRPVEPLIWLQVQQGIPVGQKQDPPQQHIGPGDLGSCLFSEVGLWLHSGPLEPEQTSLSIITFYHPQGFGPGRTASPRLGCPICGSNHALPMVDLLLCNLTFALSPPSRGTDSDLIISLPFVPDCVALTALVSWPVSS